MAKVYDDGILKTNARTFVPGYESSIWWNFRSLELSFLGTKVPAYIKEACPVLQHGELVVLYSLYFD